MLDGQRVLIPDINHSFGGSRPIGADDHSLDDAVGISFEDASIHVGARIAFIRIADENFSTAVGLFRQHLPFQACRKPRAPPAPQSGGLHLLHHPFGFHHGQEPWPWPSNPRSQYS